MSANELPKIEKLPSGKSIIRNFKDDGSLLRETHSYGLVEIAITIAYENGRKMEETYISKGRLLSRRSYEKARLNYADMPEPDATLEDFGGALLGNLRKQQRQKKIERERRFAASQESRFPRPDSTNWLRVMAKDKAHLVIFSSRDWKLLSDEPTLRAGREWLQTFGFFGPCNSRVADGVEIGFEVAGDTKGMLEVSRPLIPEVIRYAENPPERSQWQGSIRPRSKPRKQPEIAWPRVLPPLIEFLSELKEPKVTIYNHHR